MKLECDLFELETNEGFDFYFDVLDGLVECRSLYFTRKSSHHFSHETFLLGVVELVSGEISDGLFDAIYRAKKREIENFAGYIEEPEDESPFEFSTSFDFEGKHHTHHYLVKDSERGYVLMVTLLSGYNEEDFDVIRNMTGHFMFRSHTMPAQFGDILDIKMSSSNDQTKIGNRVLLNSVTV